MLNTIKKLQNIKSTWFPIILAGYFTLVFNLPFFKKIIHVLHDTGEIKVGFLLLIYLFLLFLLNMFFTLFSIKHLEKSFYIVITIISSVLSYCTYYYGIVFDTNMITNILLTNYQESVSYLNLTAIIWVFCLGGVPAIIISRLNFVHAVWYKDLLHKLVSILLSIIIIAIIIGCYYKDFAAIKRNNSCLNKMVIPLQFLWSSSKYVKNKYFVTTPEYQHLGMDAQRSITNFGKKNLLIVVVGETARSMNYQLNGYAKETNKYLAKQQIVSFKNVSSCGTDTAVSLPCMFSKLPKENYSFLKANNQDNVLDILQHADTNLLWLDNNAGCNGVCKNIEYIDINSIRNKNLCPNGSCFDEILLTNLQQHINDFVDKDSVIVLHLLGSHGPTYYNRYPQNFRYFTPTCDNSDIQNCSTAAIMNTYDNSILYTDFVLNEIIKILQQNTQNWNSAMLYVSDHGESLGENNLYLHGLPYSIAPKEQTTVPLITWFSPDFINDDKLDLSCLAKHAAHNNFSHDNIFHSILGLMHVTTKEYDSNLDLFAACKKKN